MAGPPPPATSATGPATMLHAPRTHPLDLRSVGQRAPIVRWRGRIYGNYSIAAPGGLFVNVERRRVASIGVEPTGDLVVAASSRLLAEDGRPGPIDRALVSGVAGTVCAVALLVTGRHHRRTAARRR